jgi:hypothetical protein
MQPSLDSWTCHVLHITYFGFSLFNCSSNPRVGDTTCGFRDHGLLYDEHMGMDSFFLFSKCVE